MEQHKKDKTVAYNRKARHDYIILDTFECGIALTGTEIKSVRAGKVNLRDSYAKFERGELWLMNAHISPYEKASWYQHDPRQNRKLLMHRAELRKLSAKIDLALAQGKNAHDRREALSERDAKRSIAREMRNRARG